MSQELFFEGKPFISVSRASQETGYTQDYLGQLSRASKIPARMVGRTWYVDKDAVLDYKNYKKASKPQTVKNNNQETKPRAASSISSVVALPYAPTFTYKKAAPAVLPIIKKAEKTFVAATQPAVTSFVTSPIFKVAIGFAIMILFVSGVQIIFPKLAEITTPQLSHISAIFNPSLIMDKLSNRPETAAVIPIKTTNQAGVITSNIPATSTSGVVVFPEQANHNAAVATVQNDFSDDTNVTFDKDGSSGVITPVFKKATSTDGYAFVMVPVKKTK